MKVKDINTDKKEREELQKTLDNTGLASMKKRLVSRYSDGLCNTCDALATKQVSIQAGDKDQKITRIQKYCQKHFELIINEKGSVL